MVAKTAIKFHWSSHRIDDFVSNLDKLRNSLTLATMLAFRKSSETTSEQILVHLRDLQQDLEARQLDATDVQGTIKALVDVVQHSSSSSLGRMQDQMQDCLSKINALRDRLSSEEGNSALERRILNWLDFRQISWRYESIQTAHEETYGWVFQNQVEHQSKWDDFTAHLSHDATEPYFVDGKAGSGKSTFMKFAYNHPKTRTALKVWAGTDELVMVHFFFWNLGTTLQKSYVGMLRALLHAILEQHPELIPAVFPRLYRIWTTLDTKVQPAYTETKSAFEILVGKARYLKLAIFIDGIDEFEGNHGEMSLFLRSLALHNVKLVLSSRPLNACLHAFSDCPNMRLQDLTRRDMEAVVHNKLSMHHLMIRYERQFPGKALRLASDTVDKAEGVFLWVTLVVRLLIEGLENGDNLDELQTRLIALPSDLRDLYRRMFSKMRPEHQQEAAITFRVLTEWTKQIHDQSLPGLVVSYATRSPSAVFNETIVPMTNEAFGWTMASMDKRIRSRCCGLLELHQDMSNSKSCPTMPPASTISLTEVNRSCVIYMHRTVAEFITMNEVWNEICSITQNATFDVTNRLASACLSTLKSAGQFDDCTLNWYLECVLHFLRLSAKTSTLDLPKYIFELDRSMTKLHERLPMETYREASYASLHWSAKLKDPSVEAIDPIIKEWTSIYTFIARMGLYSFPLPLPPDIDDRGRYAILSFALSSWKERAEQRKYSLPSFEQRYITLEYLLKNVAGPETSAFGSSLWLEALTVCGDLQSDAHVLEAAQLLKVVLKAAISPKYLWEGTGPIAELTSAKAVAVMDFLRHYSKNSASREIDGLLASIEDLIKRNKHLGGDDESVYGQQNANKRSRSSQRQEKKARRSKKLKMRATR
jgi:hypothetical protein